MMLNQTSFRQVDLVRHEFFEKYPNADRLSKADPIEVARCIKPLGFQNIRSKKLIRFSNEWLQWNGEDPSELHGIGEYARDSWMIFQRHDNRVKPKDRVLIKYMEWVKTEEVF